MKFRSRSDYSGFEKVILTFPQTEPKYKIDVDKETGREIVVRAGETNVYIQKQEAVKDVLLYNLIDTYTRTGDASIFGENLGGFIDVVNLPKSLLEAENVRVQAKQLFDRLPFEQRNVYGNDVFVFLKDVNDKLKAKAAAPVQTRAEAIDKEVNATNGE